MLTVGANESCEGQEAALLHIDLPNSSPSALTANTAVAAALWHPYFVQVVLVVSLVKDFSRDFSHLSSIRVSNLAILFLIFLIDYTITTLNSGLMLGHWAHPSRDNRVSVRECEGEILLARLIQSLQGLYLVLLWFQLCFQLLYLLIFIV